MATKKKPSFSAVPSRSGAGLTPWLGIAFVVILLDQISKITITRTLMHGDSKSITSFFNLVLAYNEGAAFSFLAARAAGSATCSPASPSSPWSPSCTCSGSTPASACFAGPWP